MIGDYARPMLLALALLLCPAHAPASPWFPDTRFTPPLPALDDLLSGIDLEPFDISIRDVQGDSRQLLIAADDGVWLVDRSRPGHMEFLKASAKVRAAAFVKGRPLIGGAPGLRADSAAALSVGEEIIQIVTPTSGGIWALTPARVFYGADAAQLAPVLYIESGIAGRAAAVPWGLAVPGLDALWIVKPNGANARAAYTTEAEGDVVLAAVSSGAQVWVLGKYAGISAMRENRGGFERPVAPAPLLDDVHPAGPFAPGWVSAFFAPGDGLILVSGAGLAYRVRFGLPVEPLESWPPLHETHRVLQLADGSLAAFPRSGNHLYIVNPGAMEWERINFVRSLSNGVHHHLAGMPPHPFLPALIGTPDPWWRNVRLGAAVLLACGVILFHVFGMPRLGRLHPNAERFGHQLEEWRRSYHALRRSKERSGLEWARVTDRLNHSDAQPLSEEFRLNYEERKRTLSQGIVDVDADLDRLLASVRESGERLGSAAGGNGTVRGLFNRYLESNWRRAYGILARQIGELRARDVTGARGS